MDTQPLADHLRPTRLKDFIGQPHLVGPGKIISEMLKSNHLSSLILWGPPGSGKTTLARLIANETEADFIELSAVTASKANVLNVVKQADQNQRLKLPTILFVDEIHRFNKAQQDAFLPYVESGLITLIGATTENPSFEVINPLLSRSKVLVLNPLSKADMTTILKNAAKALKLSTTRLPATSLSLIAEISGGDARVALNTLEIASRLSSKHKIDKSLIETAAQTRLPGYDKTGEYHYNLISAFIKSLRGSDQNAALYYLSRMLAAGEDPKFIARRLIVFASEDVGLAASAALNLAVSTFLAVERIGLPEAEYNLYHCALALSKAPKDRTVAKAIGKAHQAADQYADLPVPLHLRNAPTKLMKDLGYGRGIKWEAGFKPDQGFLPPEIKDLKLT